MNEIKELLKEELKSNFEALKETDIDSDEYKSEVDSTAKLIDRLVEIEKAEAEAEDRSKRREIEIEKNEIDAKERKMRIEIENQRLNIEAEDREERRNIEIEKNEIEAEDRRQQAKTNRIDMIVRNGLSAAGVILPLLAGVWATNKSLKIEFKDEDIVTSTVAKEGFRKLFQFRK